MLTRKGDDPRRDGPDLTTFQSATSPTSLRPPPAAPSPVIKVGQLPWLSKNDKNEKGPDLSSFHEHIPETSKGRKANAADQTTEEAQEEKPRGGIGALWARMSSPSASREGSAHGGNAFGQRNQSFGDLWKWVTSPAPSREGSQRGGNVFSKEVSFSKDDGRTARKDSSIGSQLWTWATSPARSPAPSREGSAHGGNAFGGMRRNLSFSGLWNWKSDSNEADRREEYGGPDVSTFQSASPTRASPQNTSPKFSRRVPADETHTDRGV